MLRVYQLGSVPVSLYWDEASLGYNAFSIATTLHDEHGEFLPYSRFIAFGDYKPPGYIYADALAIKFLGLSEFSTRLPSALAGTILVLVTFFLVTQLFGNQITALLASLFVVISPWSLQMSRAAFEANFATLLSGTGILFFLKAVKAKSIIFYLLSAVFFVASIYTFNSHRVFVPLMIGGLSLIFIRALLSQWKRALFFFACCLILVGPLIPHLLSREGSLRFTEVSWVNDLSLIEKSNKLIAQDGGGLVARVIHNRRVIFAQQFLAHYTDNFKGSFLFFSGDANPKLSIQTIGELYWLDLPFLLVGLFYLLKQKNKSSAVIFLWLLTAPIPAAFARETPHALRILQILPIPQIIIALGVTKVFQKKILCIIYPLFLLFYARDYYFNYPQKYALDWEYGYKDMVTYVKSVENNYNAIQITNKYGRPYIYMLFYNKYSPEKYWQNRKVDRDWYGFWYVHSFDKYYFDAPLPFGKTLFVREPENTPKEAKIKKQIFDFSGKVVFNIYEI